MLRLVGVIVGMCCVAAWGRVDPQAVQPGEMQLMQSWVAANLGVGDASTPAPTASGPAAGVGWPFSFAYGDRPFAELCGGWKFDHASREIDSARVEHVLTWRDPATGLVVRCAATVYRDFPVVEWTLYLENGGNADTPIIQGIQAMDARLDQVGKGDFVLHHAVGSPADGNDYAPRETVLHAKQSERITAAGGRPTNTDLCYFNLQRGTSGWIIAVGWPGQWASEFNCLSDHDVRVRIGQELTHFKLHPGEQVRSPLVALQFWQAGRDHAHNVWRRWMIAHNLPRPGGKLPPPQFAAGSSRATNEMVNANEANQIMHIDRYREEKLQLDYWWMDAGWYVNKTGWPNVGTWEVDKARFPRGLRAISDYAHSKDMKTIVWFEPERVTPGTWLYDTHPEWLMGKDGEQKLLDLGNPNALKWLTDHVDRLITEQGIGLYRQDFNMDPLDYWRGADTPDRQGIAENKHVCGLLAYWDELRRRHPDMLLDCCASGGRRNDLESLRRAVPLWRSDYAYEPHGHQSMTMGISLWIPYHGTGTVACANAPYYGGGLTPVEPYAFWSNVSPGLAFGIDIRERGLDYDALRKLVGQWRSINECYYGDYYPLTSCSRQSDQWVAWQFDRPDFDRGFVQAFRRIDSPYESARFPLRGLDPNVTYVVTRLDVAEETRVTGRELMEKGLLVNLPQRPAAAVVTYHP